MFLYFLLLLLERIENYVCLFVSHQDLRIAYFQSRKRLYNYLCPMSIGFLLVYLSIHLLPKLHFDDSLHWWSICVKGTLTLLIRLSYALCTLFSVTIAMSVRLSYIKVSQAILASSLTIYCLLISGHLPYAIPFLIMTISHFRLVYLKASPIQCISTETDSC